MGNQQSSVVTSEQTSKGGLISGERGLVSKDIAQVDAHVSQVESGSLDLAGTESDTDSDNEEDEEDEGKHNAIVLLQFVHMMFIPIFMCSL